MTAYRIVYVPGMRPKPEPALHRRALLEVLCAALSRVRPAAAERLKREEQRFELVAWTYCFYRAYRDLRIDRPGIERVLAGSGPDEEDLREIDSLSRKLRRWWHLFGDSVPWLTEAIADEEMRGLLAEVRRYLANEDGIGDEIRELVKMPVLRAWDAGESVMLVGHSLGSVIVYDTLWELSQEDGMAGEVDLLITLGSPLATRFIRKSLRGADQHGSRRYPANIRRWINFSARGELTALHPRLGPFFGKIVEQGHTALLEDHSDLCNAFHADFGVNTHKSYGYLADPLVADAIGAWIESQPA